MGVRLDPSASRQAPAGAAVPDPEGVDALADLLERAVARGYVLLSELVELHDPLTQDADWVEATADAAREANMQVVDDLTEDAVRPDVARSSGTPDSTRQYLNEIGQTELLTAEEEVDLAKRYQSGLLATQMLAEPEGLTRARRAALIRIARDGERAKHHMVQANLRLVVSVAARYRGRGVDLLALIQEGNLGLIRGVEKFDHTKGYKFSTYATWWIRQALQRGVANTSRVVRLPVHVHELMSKIRFIEVDLLQQLGRDPTDAEIAVELGLTFERLRELRLATRDVASLDRPVGDDGSASMGDLVADEHADDPEVLAGAAMAREQVLQVLNALNDRERSVLMLRYGLLDGKERTLEDIGVEFGLTRERIRQIEKKTLTKLRHPSRSRGMRDLIGAMAAG